MITQDELETFYPKSRKDWRKWLIKNHLSKPSIWLIFYKASTNKPSLSWSEAVDEALCFGWIDSTKKSIDQERYMQYFCRRKPKSTWSKINKDKVVHLIKDDLMTEAGYHSIAVAKENGSWTILDQVEALEMPEDLKKLMKKHKGSLEYYETLNRSLKKGLLYWVVSAKRPETREKRIREIVQSTNEKKLPRRFQ